MKVILKQETGLIKYDCDAESKSFKDLEDAVQFTTKDGEVLTFKKEFYNIRRDVKGFGCQYVVTEKDEEDVTEEEENAAITEKDMQDKIDAEGAKPKKAAKASSTTKTVKPRKTPKVEMSSDLREEIENELVHCGGSTFKDQVIYLAAIGYAQKEIGEVLERNNAQLRAYLVEAGLQHPKTTGTSQYKKYLKGNDDLRDKLTSLGLAPDVVAEVVDRCTTAREQKRDIPHPRVAGMIKEAIKEAGQKVDESRKGDPVDTFSPDEAAEQL